MAMLLIAESQERRATQRSSAARADADHCGRGGAEQRHGEHDRQERARDPDAADLDGEHVAADGEDEQQPDELRSAASRAAST